MKKLSMIIPPTNVPALPLDLHLKAMPTMMQLACSDKVTPKQKQRNTIKMVDGLGSWQVTSVSNWGNSSVVVEPPMEVWCKGGCPPEVQGWHAFFVWSNKYKYVKVIEGASNAIQHPLKPRASEIIVVKMAEKGKAQYIGSTLHFTCGMEVERIKIKARKLEVSFTKETRTIGDRDLAFFCLPTDSPSKDLALELNGKGTARGTEYEVVSEVPEGTVIAVRFSSVMKDNEEIKIALKW